MAIQTEFYNELTEEVEPCTNICPHYPVPCRRECPGWQPPSTTTTTTTTTYSHVHISSTEPQQYSDSLNYGTIVGISFGVILAVIILGYLSYLIYKYRMRIPFWQNLKQLICERLSRPIQETSQGPRSSVSGQHILQTSNEEASVQLRDRENGRDADHANGTDPNNTPEECQVPMIPPSHTVQPTAPPQDD